MSCSHTWRTWGRNADKERCEKCLDIFPCPDTDCGHCDCIERRLAQGKPPVCVVCEKPVDGKDPHPNVTVICAGSTLYLVTALVRGRTKVFHSSCKNQYKDP